MPSWATTSASCGPAKPVLRWTTSAPSLAAATTAITKPRWLRARTPTVERARRPCRAGRGHAVRRRPQPGVVEAAVVVDDRRRSWVPSGRRGDGPGQRRRPTAPRPAWPAAAGPAAPAAHGPGQHSGRRHGLLRRAPRGHPRHRTRRSPSECRSAHLEDDGDVDGELLGAWLDGDRRRRRPLPSPVRPATGSSRRRTTRRCGGPRRARRRRPRRTARRAPGRSRWPRPGPRRARPRGRRRRTRSRRASAPRRRSPAGRRASRRSARCRAP